MKTAQKNFIHTSILNYFSNAEKNVIAIEIQVQAFLQFSSKILALIACTEMKIFQF